MHSWVPEYRLSDSSVNNTQSHDPDENQVDGNDEIQKARHDENEDARDKRDNRLKVSNSRNRHFIVS
jgi:hypothetical protein